MNRISSRLFLLGILLGSPAVWALTPVQLLSPSCKAELKQCAQQPAMQFYLGGVFDALAHANHDLLAAPDRLYCKPESILFDHLRVLQFLHGHPEFAQQNVAAGVAAYLRAEGGCTEPLS